MKCPRCEANDGFYSNISGQKHYAPDGEEVGVEIQEETQYAYCYTCGQRVSLRKLRAENGTQNNNGA